MAFGVLDILDEVSSFVFFFQMFFENKDLKKLNRKVIFIENKIIYDLKDMNF